MNTTVLVVIVVGGLLALEMVLDHFSPNTHQLKEEVRRQEQNAIDRAEESAQRSWLINDLYNYALEHKAHGDPLATIILDEIDQAKRRPKWKIERKDK
jgi:hypothetical protein